MNKRLDVLICGGGACISSHSHEFKKKLLEEIERYGLSGEINVVETGCMGPCELGPVMVVYPDGSFYIRLKERHAEEIVQEHFLKGRPVPKLLWQAPEARKIVEEKKQVPFFEKAAEDRPVQLRQDRPGKCRRDTSSSTAMRPWARVLPGHDAVAGHRNRSPSRACAAAAVPVFRRVSSGNSPMTAKSDQKYVICNADEGDPGCIHGPGRAGRRPARGLEGMAIGRLRRRRQARASSMSAPSIRWPSNG